MKNLVIFFYIDALNSSFVNPDAMPFLSSLGDKGFYKQLENVVGYSFAIQSCLLSGKYPEETNHWMPYFYSPKASPLLFKTLSTMGSFFPFDRLQTLRYLAVRGSRQLLLRKGAQANNIPLCQIGKIALYPYYFMCELPFFFELEELLRQKFQAALTYIGPPKVKRNLQSSLLEYLRKSAHENEVVIVYDDALDALGHALGPHSLQCLDYAKSLDSALSKTCRKLERNLGKHFTFVVFSDHGQSEVSLQIDLLFKLAKEGLRLGVDYLCFVDATLALFWPKDDATKERMLEVLGGIKQGKVIDDDCRKRYHIDFDDDRYGEVVFVLKSGGTFVPNFFSPFNALKGLHGYLPEEEVQKAFLISNEDSSLPLAHVKDTRNYLLNLSS